MSRVQAIFEKFGIRFGTALFVAVAIQLTGGDWDWGTFIARCVIAMIVVAASYLVETWFKKPSI